MRPKDVWVEEQFEQLADDALDARDYEYEQWLDSLPDDRGYSEPDAVEIEIDPAEMTF